MNIRDKEGRTALMFAAFRNYPEIVQILLKKDVNPDLKSSAGNTALSCAAFGRGRHTEIVELLKQARAEEKRPDFIRWCSLLSKE
ncbi:MAG: ankyrin repeat domain-containing protein [Candidatus Lindowbacteria bacterium]|nr:ankyrin repeat domain-containing protein [Candidatus Lindowbacteria bacterium]